MSARRPIADLLADPDTSPELSARLQRVQTMRDFAARELGLPAQGSYRHYVDVGRDYVVWSVSAAPALSLEPRRWCYPVVGCLSYRGFFDLERAGAEARALRARGYDVYVAPVQAYSTLGWFDDPVLSTLLRGPPWYAASVMFHELAHQRVYVSGDTAFNEAYAVAVQEEGERRWLTRHGDIREREQYRRYRQAQQQFLAAVRATRDALRVVYESQASAAEKLARKSRELHSLRARFVELRQEWGGYRGYDRWFAQDLNNAKLALVSTYNDLVPRFHALLSSTGNDMQAFHSEVARIAALGFDARRAALPARANQSK
jgi:predicted aminopeptidase